MISSIISFLIGLFGGVFTMCLVQINRCNEYQKELAEIKEEMKSSNTSEKGKKFFYNT